MGESSGEILKKIVGRKRATDVWDELYRLNLFAAKLKLFPIADDGHPVRKIVGKPRAG